MVLIGVHLTLHSGLGLRVGEVALEARLQKGELLEEGDWTSSEVLMSRERGLWKGFR